VQEHSWTLPIPVDAYELNVSLRHEVNKCSEILDFDYYVVLVLDATATQIGRFEIAFNSRTGLACGVYAAEESQKRGVGKARMVSTQPRWLTASSPGEAGDLLYQALVDGND
jgi:hypothetical protein